MVKLLFEAHSGVRYLVLLVAVLAVLYLAAAMLRARPWNRTANALTAAFTGLLDLQMLLGVAVLLAGFRYYGALTGHIVTMALAIVAAHGLRVAARKAADDRRRYTLALTAVIVPLVLIVGGIMAIGRSIL